MDKKTLKEIKNLHWEFYWSGNWPMLDSLLMSDKAWVKEHKKIAGIVRNIRADISQGRSMTSYHAREEYQRLDSYFLKKFKKNPEFILNSSRPYERRVNSDLKALKAIFAIKNLKILSHPEIIRLFTKARKHFAYNSAIDHYDWYLERLFVPLLEQYIIERLPETKNRHLAADYINAILAPNKISRIFRERQEFFNLIAYIRKNKKLKTLAIRNDFKKILEFPKCKRLIALYLAHYNWLPVLVNNPPLNEAALMAEIKKYIKNNKPLVVQSKRLGDNYDPAILKKADRYLRKLKPSREMNYLIKGLSAMAFLRAEDYAVMSQSSYYVIPLYTEIARRLGISYYDLKEFLPQEIIQHLRQSKKISPKDLKDRLTLSVYIFYQGRQYFYTGKQALPYQKIIVASKETYGNITEFKGTPAWPGKIKGKVKLLLRPSKSTKIKKGDVVVSSFLSSMFAPELAKASAIVTEYGGLTSHPVIVAREFNIPCIVGVKNIIKYLKNGQLVEVDANLGKVKILK